MGAIIRRQCVECDRWFSNAPNAPSTGSDALCPKCWFAEDETEKETQMKTVQFKLIKPDDTEEIVLSVPKRRNLAPSDHATLEQVQGWVGGYFEVVRSSMKNTEVLCNEDGREKNLPMNRKASMITGITLLGPVLFVSVVDEKAADE